MSLTEQISIFAQPRKFHFGIGCGSCVCKTCLYWWSSRCPCADEGNCRHGRYYTIGYCERWVKYEGSQVKDCLRAVVQIYQDGYINCSLLDCVGCETCMKEWEEIQQYREAKDLEGL